MRRWLIIAVLAPVFALAEPSMDQPAYLSQSPVHQYSRDEMFNITAEAAMKRPDVALLLKNSENWLWRQTRTVGLDKNIVVPIASAVAPILARKISTRAIHMDWKPEKNLTLRPDLDYYYITGETRIAFTAVWRF